MSRRPNSAPFFSSGRQTPRERSASDAVTAVGTVIAMLALSLIAVPSSGFEEAIIELVDAVPSWLDIVWWIGAAWLVVWLLVVLLTALVRRRGDVLLDAGLSCVAALGLASVAVQRINGSWPDLSQILTGGTNGTVPLVVLATGAAFSAAVAPHLARPFRRFGHWSVTVGALSIVMLGATTPVGALISVLLGTASAALVHLALGTSAGRPTTAEVSIALAELDVSTHDLTPAPHQSGGVVELHAVDDAGAALRVKVYGRDARDARLLSRTWTNLWYRGTSPTTVGRQQQVEHEAFVTLFASTQGLQVPQVVAAGSDSSNDAILVVRDLSERLADRPADQVTDCLPEVWKAVIGLHSLGMTHGELSPDAFGIDGTQVTLRDLSSVTMGDTVARQKDVAQTLVSTALLVGIERAVVAAGDELDADGITTMLPYLQSAALGSTMRHRVKADGFEIDALRSAVAAMADVEVPDIVELRRVRPQSLITVALIALVAFALISTLGNVDLAELWDEIRNASPGWVIAALMAAQLPFAAQAVATRGAAPQPVPLGPLTLLQSSIAFVALAVPSTAGRLALDIRFFQRQGLPATSAVSIAAIDSFCGFLVQISVLLLTLAVGVGDVELNFDSSTRSGSSENSVDLARVLGALAVVVLVLAIAAIALPRIRARISERVRPALAQVSETARALRSPTKLVELFGGNLANQLLFAVALGLSLEAFGGSLNLGTLLTIYVASALFGGLMPVPGGVGVMEAALTAGLVAAGISPTTGAATAVLFRLVTYYLPPLWGWLSLRWLRHHDYL